MLEWKIMNKIWGERKDIEENNEQTWGSRNFFYEEICMEDEEEGEWSIPLQIGGLEF